MLQVASRSFLLRALAGLVVLTPASALADEYFVATTGNDSNPGTLTEPFATLHKGADVAVAGDTVFIRGGTYTITTPDTGSAGVSFTKSGTSEDSRIRFWAYEGELPIFDFAQLDISTSGYTSGFVVSGSWLHFRGLELKNVPMNTRSNNAISVSGGGNNIFELLNLHHNAGTGIFIGEGEGGHLILNSDSHDNYDPASTQGDGQNADGFGVHYQDRGPSTILRGCRAWWNSDDGYDLISQEVPVIIESSWAMGNGYINSGQGRPGDGAGNGYKVGSSKTGIRHVVRNNVAWANRAAGFYANHSSGGNDWFNNTSYMNGSQYNMLASTWDADGNRTDGVTLTGALAHKMRNNIGFPDDNSYMNGVDTGFNTWDLAIVPVAEDFASITDTQALGPRQPDGSVSDAGFMRLSSGSNLIDQGTDVGLTVVGAAADRGAVEYGLAAAGGTNAGGPAGSGGMLAGGASATPTAGTSGVTNAGGPPAAAGTFSNGGSTTGPSDNSSAAPASPPDGAPSSCACRAITATRTSPSASLSFPLLATLLLLTRRRRAPIVAASRRRARAAARR